MTDHFTVYKGWIIPISKACESWKIDINEAMKHCDVKVSDFSDHESHLSAEKTGRLIDHCNKIAHRKDFSVVVAKNFHPGMFHALGYAMMSSNCLKDAFNRIARYKKIVSNTCTLNVVEGKQSVFLNMEVYCYEDSKRPVLTHSAIESFLGTIVQFTRESLKPDFKPLAIYLNWVKPNHDYQYLEDFFHCKVIYGAKEIAIEFDVHAITTTLIGGNALLIQSHEKMLDEYMTRIDKNDVEQLVKNKVVEMLPLGTPCQSEIANILGMSLRNLQRKLNDQETCYRDILEQTRKKLALEYITQQHLMFSEIGYLVGFSNIGNFNRAFKRWTECTPGEYRKLHC